ncbi:MAG: hypothetical protein OXH75_25690 [Acidobacteria bacterium]|nr:hypothetical protein [Acidobacteriota bacterium]
MADTEAPRNPQPTQPIIRDPHRKTIPASDVGVTLTISEEARAELDRIQEETVKAAQQGQKFSWR